LSAVLTALAGIAATQCPLAQADATTPAPVAATPSDATSASAAEADLALLHFVDPVPDAAVTSPFGWRQHPILKYRIFHCGIDYGAPRGTPVLAAEAGVIEDLGRHGHYGLYLRIRHSSGVETAYAHLARFAPGLKRGMHVERGQEIAAVGTTGYATGPHLYYELIVAGHRVDPQQPTLVAPDDFAARHGPRRRVRRHGATTVG
jgi:murein DD-endopeptidase MepM/ murein hydrolase activator NlpD